jgi:hypothetical protein
VAIVCLALDFGSLFATAAAAVGTRLGASVAGLSFRVQAETARQAITNANA